MDKIKTRKVAIKKDKFANRIMPTYISKSKILNLLALIVMTAAMTVIPANSAKALPFNITYPVIGPSSFVNDFNYPRAGGIHGATDVMAGKMQILVSPVDGVVTFVSYPQPSYGYMVTIKDDSDYKYSFLHINNDNPGTYDNNAPGYLIYAPDIKPGNRVVKGQHIGYVGDSGNSNGVPHLHFEIERPDGSAENPYGSLVYANHINAPNQYPALTNELLPYGPGFNGEVKVAMGNFDGTSDNQFVTGAGAGGGPHVLVFKENNTPMSGFFAYDPSFKGGVDVATGDIDGDGTDEVITGTGANSASHVRIFEPNGQVISAFYAYPGFSTGVNVAAGDVDGDGRDEIITGTGAGWATHVKVFKPNGNLVMAFFAYPGFPFGVDVAAGDVDGDGDVEIVTSAGPGGGSHVLVFNGTTGQSISGFFAYPDFHGGVRLSVGDVDTDTPEDEILTAPYSIGGPDIRLFDMTGEVLTQKGMFERWWSGGFDPAAGDGESIIGTGGNRRGTVRSGPSG